MLSQYLRSELERRERLEGALIYDLDDKFRAELNGSEKYLAFTGGRGSGKTISIICYMIEQSFRGIYKNCLFLCSREIAGSIEDSVYSVLVDLIEQGGLSDEFEILKNTVTNKNTGVRFRFSGLRSQGGKGALATVNKIKGKHKVALVFLEEGQDLSDLTLDVLFPTVNRSGRVFLMNKQHEENETLLEARFFVAMNPNKRIDPIIQKIKTLKGKIININIFDIARRFQDAQLMAQAKLEEKEPYYDHVWLGKPFFDMGDLPFSRMELVSDAGEPVDTMIAFLDPSYKGGDYTALAFLGQGRDTGKLYVWGRAYKQSWNSVIPKMAVEIRKHKPQRFFYEDNNLGMIPRDLFNDYEGIRTVPKTSTINKETRIYKVGAFIGHKLTMIKGFSDNMFTTLVSEYSAESADYDDPPDAVASAVISTGIIKEKIKF